MMVRNYLMELTQTQGSSCEGGMKTNTKSWKSHQGHEFLPSCPVGPAVSEARWHDGCLVAPMVTHFTCCRYVPLFVLQVLTLHPLHFLGFNQLLHSWITLYWKVSHDLPTVGRKCTLYQFHWKWLTSVGDWDLRLCHIFQEFRGSYNIQYREILIRSNFLMSPNPGMIHLIYVEFSNICWIVSRMMKLSSLLHFHWHSAFDRFVMYCQCKILDLWWIEPHLL